MTHEGTFPSISREPTQIREKASPAEKAEADRQSPPSQCANIGLHHKEAPRRCLVTPRAGGTAWVQASPPGSCRTRGRGLRASGRWCRCFEASPRTNSSISAPGDTHSLIVPRCVSQGLVTWPHGRRDVEYRADSKHQGAFCANRKTPQRGNVSFAQVGMPWDPCSRSRGPHRKPRVARACRTGAPMGHQPVGTLGLALGSPFHSNGAAQA